MAEIKQQYLPPLNPEMTITEDDRARINDFINNRLSDLLIGNQSYFPDGKQKKEDLRLSDLYNFIGQLADMQSHVNDPSNVLGSAIDTLKRSADRLRNQLDRNSPQDHIELPIGSTPFTRDNRYIYVDPSPGPYSPPNPLLPKNLPTDRKASFESGGKSAAGAMAPASPLQTGARLGLYTGMPMKRRIVPPAIFNFG